MRCFVGIDLSENLREEVNRFIKQTDHMGVFYGKYVESENLHISLKFLGEVDLSKIEEVERLLSEIKYTPFTASLEGIRAFPSKHYVKVLWIGANKGRKEIIELHNLIDEKLKDIFHKDRNFEPHITLSRVKNISNKDKASSFFEKNKDIKFGEITIDSFCLYKSTLTSDGPIYEKISKFQLGR
ncbi:MAG: RNA 2',3'-cyclic phosphodiesterase [Candidatus Woesearchaeota archaeon]|nr:MAG: RNA 2',3'-cyclic phosphodiesterase [Candidatus Woesearchaeota archaeon]